MFVFFHSFFCLIALFFFVIRCFISLFQQVFSVVHTHNNTHIHLLTPNTHIFNTCSFFFCVSLWFVIVTNKFWMRNENMTKIGTLKIRITKHKKTAASAISHIAPNQILVVFLFHVTFFVLHFLPFHLTFDFFVVVSSTVFILPLLSY